MLKKFNIHLDEKAKVVVTTVAIAASTFLICSGIVKHHVRKRHDVRSRITQEREKLTLRGDIGKIESTYSEYVKYFYDAMDQQRFRLIVSGLAGESGVEIVSITPSGNKGIANISKRLLKISLRCTYSQLVEFIAKIEKLPEIVKIEKLSVTGLSDFKGYIEADEDKKKEIIESDTKTTVSLIVAAYSTKH